MSTLIIPAAGLATRLRPLSNNSSKCMVPVNGKPIISYILDRVGTLFSQIVVVYGKSDDAVRFCRNKYSHLNIEFVHQETAEGPLHAVYCAMESLNLDSSPLTIWLGDTIVTDYVPSGKTEMVVHEVPDWSRWCMMSRDGELFDKPEDQPPTNLALVGIYTFDDSSKAKSITSEIIFSKVKVRGEYQLSQLISAYGDSNIVETKEWFDCGDLPSLYESSSRLLKKFACRPDSSVDIDLVACTFKKTGDRCRNESFWYKNIPARVKPFVPAIYETSETSYTMELLNGTTVADMLLFEDLTKDNIQFIIRRCLDSYRTAFLKDIAKTSINILDEMLFLKNMYRVYEYDRERTLDYATYASTIVNKYHGKQVSAVDFCHGDFHLGNIMFSPENGRVKFIDPRGKWGKIQTTYGYIEYDLIKFAQSLHGEYVWVYAGVPTNEYVKKHALDTFSEWCIENEFDLQFILEMVPILMGSVLEFHTESPTRQGRIWQKTLELIDDAKR